MISYEVRVFPQVSGEEETGCYTQNVADTFLHNVVTFEFPDTCREISQGADSCTLGFFEEDILPYFYRIDSDTQVVS